MIIEKVDGFYRLVIDRMEHRFVIGLDIENDKICLYERNCSDDHALWFFKGYDRADKKDNSEVISQNKTGE